MALDIHKLEKGRPTDLLLSLDQTALTVLQPAFARFKQATGLVIDPYGTLKLSSGLEPLLVALRSTLPTEKQKALVYAKMIQALEVAEQQGNAVVLVGD